MYNAAIVDVYSICTGTIVDAPLMYNAAIVDVHSICTGTIVDAPLV